MTTFLVVLAVLAAIGFFIWRYVESLDGGQKSAIKDGINDVFVRAEARGRFPRAPAFIHDYEKDYPEIREFEKHFDTIREECLSLLGLDEQLPSIEVLGGGYTAGGTHKANWKSFMFKQGEFIPENCRLAPKTAKLIEKVPGVYTAFFSILGPNQYIPPHFGYYKGFLRYHLGILVPNDNANNECWIRINADPEDNRIREKSLIDKGEKYYWHEGQGVMFDDTFLHEAANDSGSVRVVLWFDVARKMPWYLDAFNKLCLFIVHKDSSVRSIREKAAIDIQT